MLRRSGAYAVGEILVRGLGWLLLPVYAVFLRPEDFGVLAIASVVTSIAAVLFALGMNGAALKFYYDFDDETRRQFQGTIWLFMVLVPGAFMAVVELLHGAPLNWLLRQIPYAPYTRLALWTAYLTVILLVIPQEQFRASGNSAGYVALNVGQFVVATGLTIWLVVVLRTGAEGALWARLGGVAAVGLAGTAFLRRTIRLGLNAAMLRSALAYGLPLVPHFLSHWVLSASDRVILQKFVPLSDVGVYAVGYQIGSVMMLVATAGNNSMIPLFGRLDLRRREEVERLVRIVTYYVLGLMFVALSVAMFSGEFIRLLPEAYGRAAGIVPWVAFGYLFMALYYPGIDVLNLVLGDTRRVAATTMLAAAINVALNLVLIPRYGMIAAAITTATTYMLTGLIVFGFSRALPLPYEYRRILMILVAGIIVYAVSNLAAPSALLVRLLVKGLALIGFPALLWATGFFVEPEHVAVRLFLAAVRRSFSVFLRRLRGSGP